MYEGVKKNKMKIISPGNYEYEEGEPSLRSCPECNPAHEHLMKTNRLHLCFECGRYWILGKYLSDFETDEEVDKFLLEHKEELEADWNCAPTWITIKVGDIKND